VSLVNASERLVTLPKDESLADSASEESIIVVDELRMRYGPTEAIAGINLRVARGEIFAFLGPNGAGRTTTVEILEGFRERTGGTVSVLGVDPSDGDGFDPSARRTAWSVIEGLRDLGKTVFLTTHYMDEAENLADRIAVIANGRIVAEGTPGGPRRTRGDGGLRVVPGPNRRKHRVESLRANPSPVSIRSLTDDRERDDRDHKQSWGDDVDDCPPRGRCAVVVDEPRLAQPA
jgi:ABC-type multidrug transport system ATPase subunit